MPSGTRSPAGAVLRALRDNAVRKCLPAFAQWELTQRCPLRCRHCYLAGRSEAGELDTAEAMALLGEMAKLGVLFVTFTGGEPLLRRDFLDIVDEARRLGFAWRLFTSGTLIDARAARLIAERMPLAVDVSLHGMNETHDGMTGVPGSFRAATEAVRLLAAAGVTVNVKCNLTPAALGDLPALRTLAERAGTSFRAWTVMFPDFDSRPVAPDLVLSEDELRAFSVEREEARPSSFGRARRPGDDDPLCGAGRSTFNISPRGDVRPCVMLGEPCGNVRETPLRDILGSTAMARYRGLRAGARAGCRECEDAEFCFFCPGLAEKETGDPLGSPPTSCREARIRHELFRIAAGGDETPGIDRSASPGRDPGSGDECLGS